MDNFDNVLVIDADGHVSEGNIDFASRLPEKWRLQAPVKVKDNLGYTRNLIEGRVWSPSQGPAPGVTGPFTEKARKSRPGMTDPVERLKDMDLEGIDVAILFGTPIALTVNGLMSGEFAAALCRVVNEWLLEYCAADPKRLRAVGLIPCQAPEIAVKELEFLAKAGAISAMLPTNVYGRNMGDPMFFPDLRSSGENRHDFERPSTNRPRRNPWSLRRHGGRQSALFQVSLCSHDRLPLRVDDRDDAYDR